MNTTSGTKRILFSGKITGDIVSDMTHIEALGDSKYDAKSLTFSLGGASANVARAIQSLATVFGGDIHTKIMTSQGKLAGAESFEKFSNYLFVSAGQDVIYRLLKHNGIDYMDLCEDIRGTGFPINIVIESKNGRSIMRQSNEDVAKQARRDRVNVAQGVIEAEVDTSDLVFIDPTKPFLGESVIQACLKRNTTTIIDYGLQGPLKDEVDAQRLDFILRNADVLIVPGDAWIEGMVEGEVDPQKLFEVLVSDEYRAHTVILSDGAKPVRVSVSGEEHTVEVAPIEGPKYKNGAGDTRDGAFLYFLSQGDDILTAAKKATFMASVKIRYPGNTWLEHITEHAAESDLF